VADRGWRRRFEDPIPLPDGRTLITLRDAADYMLELSQAQHDMPHWQTAGEAVIMAAEGQGPLLHARVGMLRATHAGKPAPAKQPRRKRAKAYRIVR
jgi:hypothetical protein